MFHSCSHRPTRASSAPNGTQTNRRGSKNTSQVARRAVGNQCRHAFFRHAGAQDVTENARIRNAHRVDDRDTSGRTHPTHQAAQTLLLESRHRSERRTSPHRQRPLFGRGRYGRDARSRARSWRFASFEPCVRTTRASEYEPDAIVERARVERFDVKVRADSWVPFLNTYRTTCIAPGADFRETLWQARSIQSVVWWTK
jgi:hypothetical protein